jgi:CYTH domain-containing protein
MGIEIERKFLVRGDDWRSTATGIRYRQGYLCNRPGCSVRVRLGGAAAWLTVKGETIGMARPDFEYPVPLSDADGLLALCLQPLIEKVRYRVSVAGLVWEVDEFAGDNAGLVLAEVELSHAGQAIELPSWAGREVTGDPRYYNTNLQRHPFRQWPDRPDLC